MHELHPRARRRCVLTDPNSGAMAPELVPLAAALKTMKRANSGQT